MAVGDIKKIVFINRIREDTAGTEQATDVCLYFSFTQDIAEQVVTEYSQITGVTADSILDKKLKAHFATGNKTTVIRGEDIGTSGNTFAEALALVENDYICAITDEQTLINITSIKDYLVAFRKIYIFSPESSATAAELETYMTGVTDEAVMMVASKNSEVEDARVAGFFINLTAGEYLWANTQISGMLDGGWTSTEQATLKAANISYPARYQGGGIAFAEGVTADGTPGDYVHCMYTLEARLGEDVANWLKRTPKPAFVDLGDLKTTIRTRTTQFEDNDALISGRTSITTPALEDIPDNDVIAGKLTGVKITCYYQYGVKEIQMTLYTAI